jgi:hypothetical protein
VTTEFEKEEGQEIILNTIGKMIELGYEHGQIVKEFGNIVEGWNYAEFVYQPDEVLVDRIDDYNAWLQSGEGEDAGKLMEEIAYLAFRCLKGWDSMKSFQSHAPQHDLVITGSSELWYALMEHLHLPKTGRVILVEAKNLGGSVSDAQFTRLCAIIADKYRETAHLGVFFTREGISGFPAPPENEHQAVRQRYLRDARASQIIFHASTNKFVVALGDSDIQQLVETGSLPRILEAKIRDVEDTSGLPLHFNEQGQETDLPQHLSRYLEDDGG